MKVSELIRHLTSYVAQDPKHKDVDVLLQYNDGEAFSVGTAHNYDAMGVGMSTERFLVLIPNFHQIRLELNKKVN